MKDCFARGELPFASHALYTQPEFLVTLFLKNEILVYLQMLWTLLADKTVVYTKYGISKEWKKASLAKRLVVKLNTEKCN